MNFQQLRYVMEVEVTRSISKAAKNLYMGQPNLSKAIKELEEEVGIKIFRRTSKGVEPTRQGSEFIKYASSIIHQLDELQSIYQPSEMKGLELKVTVPRATYLSVAFGDFVNEFVEEKNLNVVFKESNSVVTIKDVANGNSRIGVVRYQVEHEEYFMKLLKENGLKHETILEFQMVLLMNQDHPLAKSREIPYRILRDYIEIVHGDNEVSALSISQERLQEENNYHNIWEVSDRKIYVYDRGSQFNLLKRVKNTYMWVSPIPFDILTDLGLVMKPCVEATLNKDVIIYQDKTRLMDVERSLIEKLKEAAREGFHY